MVFMIVASIFFWFFVVLFCFGSFFMEGFFSRFALDVTREIHGHMMIFFFKYNIQNYIKHS